MIPAVLALAVASSLELSPGTRYDPAVPTLKQVVGHEVGGQISSPDQIAAYLEALAAAAPDRRDLGGATPPSPVHLLARADREAGRDQGGAPAAL